MADLHPVARFRPRGGRPATYCVRLTRKLAEQIDGVELAGCEPGDLLYLREREASLLLAEGWGELVEETRAGSRRDALSKAADRQRKCGRRRAGRSRS